MTELYCRATMNYALSLTDIDPVEVQIFNGRKQPDLSWSEQGFELIPHESALNDWSDENRIASQHYAEMEALALRLSGCDHALIAGHILRNPSKAALHDDFAPIQYVHSDFTESYGDLIRDRYLDAEPETQQALQRAGIDLTDVVNARRILILQFWRNIGPREVDLPLAFCDARSVPREDLVAYHVREYGGQASPFDTFGVTRPEPAESHRWYVFPAMGADEVVAFRTYDSDLVAQGRPFWTPHSAFQDPSVKRGEPRHSIELRATCLWSD